MSKQFEGTLEQFAIVAPEDLANVVGGGRRKKNTFITDQKVCDLQPSER